jgi:hypothetical protein
MFSPDLSVVHSGIAFIFIATSKQTVASGYSGLTGIAAVRPRGGVYGGVVALAIP